MQHGRYLHVVLAKCGIAGLDAHMNCGCEHAGIDVVVWQDTGLRVCCLADGSATGTQKASLQGQSTLQLLQLAAAQGLSQLA